MQQSISQKIIFQRYYSLMLNSIGELLKINFISGDFIEGILYAIDPINNEFFIINNPRRLSRTGIPIFLKESKLKIYFREISHIDFEIKNILKYIKSNFETDLQVSKKNTKNDKVEKKLVKYEVNENDKNIFTYKGLEDDLNDKDNDANWDQFEINKKKYNVISTYDENLYTTKLDKSKITKEQNDYAEKIYNEIKNSSYNEKNIHILEDRGIIDEKDGDFDEEDKYSSVIKNKTNNNINKKKNVNVQNFFDNKYNNINGFDQFSQNNNNNCFNNINFANFYNYNNNKFGQDSSNININNKDFQNFPNNNLCNNYIYNNYSKNNNFNNIDLNIKKNNNN